MNMNNKFSEGQTVLYQGEPVKITDCWQSTTGVWLYNVERADLVIWNVAEAHLSLPVDQQMRQSGAEMLPGMEGE